MRTVAPISLAVLILVSTLASPAAAVDPQCVDATPANPAQIQDWTAGIKLCTPLLDEAGDPLATGELERCTVLLDGVAYATVTTSVPGTFFLVPPPTSGPKRGRIVSATCEGQAGVSQPTPSYDALLRRAKPGKPLLIP